MAKHPLSGLFFSLYKTVTNVFTKKRKGIERIKKIIASLEVLFYYHLELFGRKKLFVFPLRVRENFLNFPKFIFFLKIRLPFWKFQAADFKILLLRHIH